MRSTDRAYGATAKRLRACYVMSGTDVAYGATSGQSRAALSQAHPTRYWYYEALRQSVVPLGHACARSGPRR
eukprot:384117-Rhodomonas_salina.4